ncbi:MAG: flagellar assembly protein FliW [Acidobacteriota bacterium]
MKPHPTVADDVPVHVQTRFGAFDVRARDMVSFPEGLPGFEQCRNFVVLTAEHIAPFQGLHAVDGPPASFLTIDPRRVMPAYRCQLSRHDQQRLSAGADTVLLWLAIVTLTEGQAFANLRAPVVINPARMVGFQVMPLNALYPLRHPLTDGE